VRTAFLQREAAQAEAQARAAAARSSTTAE
jgi:hypothetical protein